MSAATPTVLPEQFGHYRIVERLGEGGMGSVYLARDTVANRMVALKVAHHPADGKGQVLQRLQREASALATLNHPNLCPVFDVGVIDNIHFIAMAHIEGPTLAEWHKNSRPRPQMEAAALVAKLALAMHEAHKAGIIHRDLMRHRLVNVRHAG